MSACGASRRCTASTGSGYSVSDVGHYLLWHISELDLYVGMIGFAALFAMWFAPRAISPAARAFVAATLPVTVLLVAEVAVFASRQSFRIEERNDFYIAPLAMIAMVGLLAQDVVPTSRRVRIVAATIAGGLLPWWWLQDQGISFGALRFLALAIGLALAVAFVLVPRRFALVFPALACVYFVFASAAVENGRHGIHRASAGALFAGIRVTHPDWIYRKVGHGANVSFLWHYAGETRPLWNNEFFNRSVRTVYTLDGPDPADGGLPETPVFERRDGTLATAAGAAPHVRYVVSYVDVAGKVLARDSQIGLALYRVDGPLVILTRITGVYPDTWGGRVVTYHRNRCTGGTLSMRLGTDEHLFTSDQTLTVTERGRVVRTITIAPTDLPTVKIPLRPANGMCAVRFTAAKVRVPGPDDQRRLAAHYYSFDFSK